MEEKTIKNLTTIVVQRTDCLPVLIKLKEDIMKQTPIDQMS